MSEHTNTLAGLLQLNDRNIADIFPSNILQSAPVLGRLFAQPPSQGGTLHKYNRVIAAAGSGFRVPNTGIDNAAEQIEAVDVVCKYIDGSFTRDVALAKGYRDGLSGYIQRETAAALRSTFANAEKSIFQNVGQAFDGLLQFDDYSMTGSNQTQVIDADGSTNRHSVWMLRTAEDGVSIIAGNDGNFDMEWNDDSPTIVRVLDASGKPFSAYQVTIGGWLGLQVGSKYDAVRIANLGDDKPLDDDLLSKAIERFPVANTPNLIVMNRKAWGALQRSRTATNPTGAEAPFPQDAHGIPIVVTDNLPSNEAKAVTTTTATTTTSTVA